MKTKANDFFPQILFSSMSDQGLVRANNEDALLCLPDDGCFIVADGMGGGDAGEIASAMVVDSIRNVITGSANESPGERKYILQQSLHKVHKQIADYIVVHGYAAMGSTVAFLIFDSWDSRKALVCHVGDSRVYCLRNKELFRITNDHNIATEIARKNESTDKKLENSSLKNLLTRSIGAQHTLFPEWTPISLCKEDLFLICSDGITSMLVDEQIKAIMEDGKIPAVINAELRNAVLSAGAKDNFSVICIKIDALGKAFIPDDIELKESNYLLKISEERIDYGTL